MAESDAGDRLNVVQSILELKNHDPFTPFTVVLTSGDHYLIQVPENLVEMRTEFFYAERGGDRFKLFRKSEIAAIERGRTGRSAKRKAC